MYLRKILLNNIYVLTFIYKSKFILKAKGNIHKKKVLLSEKQDLFIANNQKKGFIIKKTGFDFEKKNPVRGKGFTQQKNRNCKRYKNIKTGFI